MPRSTVTLTLAALAACLIAGCGGSSDDDGRGDPRRRRPRRGRGDRRVGAHAQQGRRRRRRRLLRDPERGSERADRCGSATSPTPSCSTPRCPAERAWSRRPPTVSSRSPPSGSPSARGRASATPRPRPRPRPRSRSRTARSPSGGGCCRTATAASRLRAAPPSRRLACARPILIGMDRRAARAPWCFSERGEFMSRIRLVLLRPSGGRLVDRDRRLRRRSSDSTSRRWRRVDDARSHDRRPGPAHRRPVGLRPSG